MTKIPEPFFHHLDKSALFTVLGIILLFSASIGVVLIAPNYVDPTWTQPTSAYQVQMYEESDPNFYVGTTYRPKGELQAVYHVRSGHSLLAFQESDFLRIVALPDLQKYVTTIREPILKLTSRLLMLRQPLSTSQFDAIKQAEEIKAEEKKQRNLAVQVLELYDPGIQEMFAIASTDSLIENWVDPTQFLLIGDPISYSTNYGTIYVSNPQEFRLKKTKFGKEVSWHYDPNGEPLASYEELKSHPLTFKSRQELIREGERLFAVEGCWYCHTDQTRTLIQDVVLNGSAAYPAPPSSANEYIYQHVTFPGTKRNGPDLSRVGVKRPGRDWHRGHFWSPKTASTGSIMPSFKHFFDNDPSGIGPSVEIPNYKFEAMYQYLMTKGTRITPPTQAWWLGKDPINTKAIIEGKRIVNK